MLSSLLLATALQIGPFFEKGPDSFALRPIVSCESETTDVLWPLFTKHSSWWRCSFIAHYAEHSDSRGYSFSLLPFWFSGSYQEKGVYAALFPLYGKHPNIVGVYDLEFAAWPLWMRYKMPRGKEWLETESVFFPFFSRRSDGAWSVWPIYGVNIQRESVHRYVAWPLVTWASYSSDRDTSGAGYSWMVWPIFGKVKRERESQTMILPPFFSFAEAYCPVCASRGNSAPSLRIRAPWPFFEYESSADRSRLSLFPFYENITDYKVSDGKESSSVMRFGWRFVEIYDDEVRVFPFWASGRNHTRLWPLWEVEEKEDVKRTKVLSLLPIRWAPAVERNWAKFWTIYESESTPLYTDHSLFWGILKWRSQK